MNRYLEILRGDAGELDILAKDLLINVTSFFRDPKVFDFLAEKIVPDLVRNQAPDRPIRIWIAGCSTRRGDLFPCHAVPRADRGGETQRQASGLRLRCRPGRRRPRPRGPLSGNDRGGGFTGTACPVLCQGRSRLSRVAGIARDGGLHHSGRAGRSAVLAPRPGFLPESSDLFAPRSAGENHLAVPFRAARGRRAAARQLGDDRRFGRPLRSDLQAGAALSAYRPRPAGRTSLFDERWRARSRSPRAGPRALAPRRARRTVPAPGDGGLCAGGGADQSQIRMPLFPRTDGPLSAVGAGAPDARFACHGAGRTARQASIGDPAGQSKEHANCRRRRSGRRRWRRGFVQHRRPPGSRATAKSCC